MSGIASLERSSRRVSEAQKERSDNLTSHAEQAEAETARHAHPADTYVGDYKAHTWAGNHVSDPDVLARPRTVPELQAAVLFAVKTRELPIVVRGKLHSWSPVAIQDDGTAIDLSRFASKPRYDSRTGLVAVPGGMLLSDLFDYLETQGRALAHAPTVRNATVAGVIATGSHGADRDAGIFADLVTSLRLIDGRGRDILINETGVWHNVGGLKALLKSGPEHLRYARRHLGTLGVVYELKLATVPAFDLELVQKSMHEKRAFGRDGKKLRAYFDKHEHAGFAWFIREKRVLLRYANPTTKKRTPRGFFKKVIVEKGIQTHLASALMKLARRSPKLGRALHTTAAAATAFLTKRRDRSDRIMAHVPAHATGDVRMQTIDYGVDYQHLERLIEVVRDEFHDFPLMIPIYFRRSGDVMFVEFVWPDGYPGAESKARAFEARLIREFGSDAIPHFGKRYFRNPWNRLSDEERGVFSALKSELDPKGAFTNDYLRRFLAGEEDLE